MFTYLWDTTLASGFAPQVLRPVTVVAGAEVSEKLAAVGTLAADATHEMGTPLSTIAVVAKELEHYVQQVAHDLNLAEDAAIIRAEVDRCASIICAMSTQGQEFAGEHIQRVLSDVEGNISQAAKKLGLHRRSLQRKLSKFPPRT